MGTRANPRQGRRSSKRGLASFVSFVLLFTFALGQSSLSALADDAGTDPVAEEVLSGGSRDEATVPVAEEAPAEEAPAQEAPVAEADGDAGASADSGAASTESGGARTGQINVARASRTYAVAAPPATELDGGDIDLDYVAAGPFTYNHATGLGTHPQFGYDNRQISKSNGVVESLEAGDFECGDFVTFFTEITVDSGAAAEGTIELDYTFGAETTGQPGLGFDDIIDVDVNKPDDGNKNLDGDEVATLIDEGFDSSGYDQVTGTVQITGLDPGDVVIVRLIAELTCLQGETPTGNILNAIESGRVSSNGDDTIPVGQQTVPMKTSGFVAEPAIDIEKICETPVAFGDDITYDITITNNGNEDLENIIVIDTVNGNTPDDISHLFADTLLAGASDSAQYVYTPDANDPDPLPNTVTVTADGVFSSDEVSDTDTCDTDITHVPGIDVDKTCPDPVLVGEDVIFTITLENTGNEPLENVVVNDAKLGGDITAAFNLPDPLPVGDTVYSHDFTYTPGANEDPVVNTVTASGDGVDSGVTATDDSGCETDILNPSIDVTKTCPEFGTVGGTLTYTITVENDGDETLDNVEVIDSLLGDLSLSFADTLAVGASESHDFDYEVQPGDQDPLPNEVTATATGVTSDAPVDDSAECETDILKPSIGVEKSCTALVHVGDTVTYTITVRNTGDEDLDNVTVVDSILGDLSASFADELAVGASESHDFDYVVLESDPDPLVNEVTAKGSGVGSRVAVEALADCVTDVIHPGIEIVKTVDDDLVPIGTTVTYTYRRHEHG